MIRTVVALVASKPVRTFIVRIGTVWLYSFVATSGGIWSRRVHKDPEGPPRPPRRPYGRRPTVIDGGRK